MARVYTISGEELEAGLSGDEAMHAAERHADHIGAEVVVQDDDVDYVVYPAQISGYRRPADWPTN